MRLQRKTYSTEQEKRKDLFLGFFGWFLINVLAYFIFPFIVQAVAYLIDLFSREETYYTGYSPYLLLVPLIFNVGLLIFLARYRRWMAYGSLAAIGTIFVLGLCLAAFVYVSCSNAW